MNHESLDRVINKLVDNYQTEELFFAKPDRPLPSHRKVVEIVNLVRTLIFPGYFDEDDLKDIKIAYAVNEKLIHLERLLSQQVYAALNFRDGGSIEQEELKKRTNDIVSRVIDQLPHLQELLLKDAEAAFNGDPAAQSKQEIIFAYPGLFAIFTYRFSHLLYKENVPLIPRILSEYAHNTTGVDIGAGAEIGEYFFIDHATGVVIGETTRIGNHVKIYQGVTLGALSTRAGQKLAGVKRHPTIEDNVTIYSNASVLGGRYRHRQRRDHRWFRICYPISTCGRSRWRQEPRDRHQGAQTRPSLVLRDIDQGVLGGSRAILALSYCLSGSGAIAIPGRD